MKRRVNATVASGKARPVWVRVYPSPKRQRGVVQPVVGAVDVGPEPSPKRQRGVVGPVACAPGSDWDSDRCASRACEPVACAPGSDHGVAHRLRFVVGTALVLAISTVVCLAGSASAQSGGGYDLTWNTVNCGGETFSTGGDFELSGTIGQHDAGYMSGGDYDLTGGFWFPVVAGDCNADGGVNLFDYDVFEACMTGPVAGPLSPECACFDLDGSGTVDMLDFGELQEGFSGS